jgi:hypothetical protein
MPDFTLTIISYAIGFAVIAGVVALVRKSMKKKNPEALKMSLEQLGVEWAVIQLSYGIPTLFALVLIFLLFILVTAMGVAELISVDAMLAVAFALFGLLAIVAVWLSWPGLKLAAKAGPEYFAMRRNYAQNRKAYLEEALKDSRVHRSQKVLGKSLSKLVVKMAHSKTMKY